MSPRFVTKAILVGLGLLGVSAACRNGGSLSGGTTARPTGTPVAETGRTRIMPLGDSITQADAEHDSYRRSLWMSLESRGYKVDFVGSQDTNHRGGPPHADFDTDHEGHWGFRVDEILESLGGWVEAHRPTVLLVHLGSNDLFQRQSVESTVSELSELIDVVRGVESDAAFLLAQILPTTTESANSRIRELNALLPALAEAKSKERSPVMIVNHFDGFDARSQTYDGVHPNADGERHMAERWLAALEEILE